MPSRMISWRATSRWMTLALVLASSLDASAQAPKPDAAREEAYEHFKRGNALFRQGAWAAALAELTESRRLFPTRNAAANAAVCLRKLGRFDEALDLYEALLRDFPDVDAELRADAETAIRELKLLVGAIVIDGAEAGATVTINGQARGELPSRAPLRVPAGSHVVRVYKEDFMPFEARVEVAGGTTVRVAVSLRVLKQSGRLRVVELAGRKLDVVVDGNIVGKTPWEGPLSPEDHKISMRGPGRLGTPEVTRRVRFKELTSLTMLAEDLWASLDIVSYPEDTTIMVDGVVFGQGTWKGQLSVGDHAVEVSAPGLKTIIKTVRLGTLEHQSVTVDLRTREPVPQLAVELDGGLLVIPSFGAAVAGACSGSCQRSVGLGGLVALRLGNLFGKGLRGGGMIGYLSAEQHVTGRATRIYPVGLRPSAGAADDTLVLRAVLAGVWAAYSVGDRPRLDVRASAGVALGTLRDERTGTFQPTFGSSYSIGPEGVLANTSALYMSPGAAVSVPLTGLLRLFVAADTTLAILLARPTWRGERLIDAKRDGIATFPNERLIAPVLFGIAPSVGLRYDL